MDNLTKIAGAKTDNRWVTKLIYNSNLSIYTNHGPGPVICEEKVTTKVTVRGSNGIWHSGMDGCRTQNGRTGCSNAVPVVWLPAGQSLQNTGDGPGTHGWMVTWGKCNKGKQAWGQDKGRQVEAWQMRTS